MLVGVVTANRRRLGHGAALLVLAGLSAGCSSQMARFDSVDNIFTASTANQRAIISREAQPFPGDVAPAPVAAAPVDPVSTGTVARGALTPVSSQPLPAPVAAAPRPSSAVVAAVEPVAPRRPFTAASPVDETVTGAVERPATKPAPTTANLPAEPEGWSRGGGTQVTVKDGETIYNLSRRFGVPPKVLAQVNGLESGASLKAGQKIVIPAYIYSQKAAVSAPDSDPNVADAKSSTGSKFDVPAKNVPVPSHAPKETVAVLPQKPAVREKPAPATADTASADAAKPAVKTEPRKIELSKTEPTKLKPETVAAAEKKPEPKKQASASGGYTVQSGDTLSKIARKTGVSVAALKAANGMQDGILKIGQPLKVPAAGTQVAAAKPAPVDPAPTGSIVKPKAVATDESTSVVAPAQIKKDEKVIEQAEASPEAAPDATGIGKMRWPVKGRVVAAYGKGGGKDGIDIAVPEGTPVKAAENGVVIYAGDGLKEFGNTVLVKHEDGLVTVYGNASELNVKRGQKVKRGDQIAVSGMSGSATSPKLHFEVRKNSAPVDPSTFLE